MSSTLTLFLFQKQLPCHNTAGVSKSCELWEAWGPLAPSPQQESVPAEHRPPGHWWRPWGWAWQSVGLGLAVSGTGDPCPGSETGGPAVTDRCWTACHSALASVPLPARGGSRSFLLARADRPLAPALGPGLPASQPGRLPPSGAHGPGLARRGLAERGTGAGRVGGPMGWRGGGPSAREGPRGPLLVSVFPGCCRAGVGRGEGGCLRASAGPGLVCARVGHGALGFTAPKQLAFCRIFCLCLFLFFFFFFTYCQVNLRFQMPSLFRFIHEIPTSYFCIVKNSL